jgi:hypothetical protein
MNTEGTDVSVTQRGTGEAERRGQGTGNRRPATGNGR